MSWNFLSFPIFDIFAFFAYFIIVYWYSNRLGSGSSEEDYLLAGRKTTLIPLAATLIMTEFNPSTLIGFSSVGAFAGIWGVSMPLIFLVGLGFYTVAVSKKWKEFNGFTTPGYFTQKYGVYLGKISSLFLLLAMAGFSATYIKATLIFFQPLLPEVSDIILAGAFIALILSLMIRKGLFAVIQIDIISIIGTILFLILLFFFSLKESTTGLSGLSHRFPIQDSLEALPFSFVLSLIVLTMFTYIASPWYGQKIFSANDPNTARKAMAITAVAVFLFYALPVISVSLIQESIPGIKDPQVSIPEFLSQKFPLGLRGFSFAVVFLISATTLSGIWSTMTSLIVCDFLGSPQKSANRSRWITLGIANFSGFLGVTLVDNILQKLILANIPIAAISFAILAGFYWEKVRNTGVYLSIGFGIFWGVFSYFYWGETGGYTTYWAFIGIPGIFLFGILGSYLELKLEKTN
jgi:Na+/proline symporter